MSKAGGVSPLSAWYRHENFTQGIRKLERSLLYTNPEEPLSAAFRLFPARVGADLSAKGPVKSPDMYRLNYRIREQAKRRPIRSHGLRPESKAGLCITLSVGTMISTIVQCTVLAHKIAVNPVRACRPIIF
ncbi:hypothetical protein F4W70_02730 [Pseudomonas cannabina]|nr:hypothetical protein F4W70_02730 [Pseudomonas cannabina]